MHTTNVLQQIGLIIGPVWAVGAAEGLLPSVDEQVVAQVLAAVLASDVATTHWTYEVLPRLLPHHAANHHALQQDHALSGCRFRSPRLVACVPPNYFYL